MSTTSIMAKRCDFEGYLLTKFFDGQQTPAQTVVEYLTDDRLKNIVFFEKPTILYVDTDYSIKPPAYHPCDSLMKSLQENGPLVTEGTMGPSAYTEPPFRLKEEVCNQAVYGWKPSTYKGQTPRIVAILIGARQVKSQSYVYFIKARDITQNSESLIRAFEPSTDARVFVMTYKNFFLHSLFSLHPICPHGDWLYSISVNSILDGGEVQKKCKQVGQEIFDHYKKNSQGDSSAGMEAVVRICDAAKVLTSKGSIRKSHLERAWDGIGDSNWRWRS